MNRLKTRLYRHGIHPIAVLPLGFLCIVLIGALLLMLPISGASTRMRFGEAVFTAVSASCVNGLMVVDLNLHLSLFGQAVILLLIQVGGLGFMTMSTILFSLTGRKISLRDRMSIAESLGESRLQGVVRLSRAALLVTLIAEALGALLLAPRFITDYGLGKGLWYSLFHSVSAFCNAGFSLMEGRLSLVSYASDPYFLFVIMLLVILGGLGFSVILNVWQKRRFKLLRLHAKLVLCGTAALIAIGTGVFLILEYDNPLTLGAMPFGQKLLNALFQSVSMRTAGFSTIDQLALRDASKGVSIMLMLFGGAPGSTAGGLKVTTLITLLLAVIAYIRGRTDTTVFGRTIPHEQVRRSLTLFFAGSSLLVTMTVLLSAVEQGGAAGQLGIFNQFYEVASALCTVGISSGVTALASAFSRVMLAILMFVGRVGFLTLAMSLVGVNDSPPVLRYPSEDILIG